MPILYIAISSVLCWLGGGRCDPVQGFTLALPAETPLELDKRT